MHILNYSANIILTKLSKAVEVILESNSITLLSLFILIVGKDSILYWFIIEDTFVSSSSVQSTFTHFTLYPLTMRPEF